MGLNELDLSKVDVDDLDSYLETNVSDQINHLKLHVGSHQLNNQIINILQRFKDNMQGVTSMELGVYMSGGSTNGEECAREFLDDYDKILTFSTRVKEIVELKRIVETATGYNYNLDESSDLEKCIELIKESPHFQNIKIEIDDSYVHKLLNEFDDGQTRILFDIELRCQMDD